MLATMSEEDIMGNLFTCWYTLLMAHYYYFYLAMEIGSLSFFQKIKGVDTTRDYTIIVDASGSMFDDRWKAAGKVFASIYLPNYSHSLHESLICSLTRLLNILHLPRASAIQMVSLYSFFLLIIPWFLMWKQVKKWWSILMIQKINFVVQRIYTKCWTR